MRRLLALLLFGLVACSTPPTTLPQDGDGDGHVVVQRQRNGRIKRSSSAKRRFQADHPCPATNKRSGSCPGYVIDHIKPLACGGADDPSNMQWQTIEEGKAKDKWELKGPGCPVR